MKYIDASMFVVLVRYLQPEEIVLRHLTEHRAFVESGYEAGYFVVSGAGVGKDPGIIVATGLSKTELREFLKGDPFHLNNLASYEVLEFHGSRARDCLALD